MAQRIRVYVTNRTATLTSEYDESVLTPYWSYSVPKYKWILQAKPWLRKCRYCDEYESKHVGVNHQYEPVWNGRENYLRNSELPAGLFWATRKEIEKNENIKFIVQGELERAELKTDGILGSNRDYQTDCITQMLKVLRFGGGLVLGATGTGKTRMASMYFSRVAGEHLFVVDQVLLMEQAIEEIQEALGEPVGRVGDSEFEPQRITVATRQSMFLHRKAPYFMKWTNKLQTLVIDEIHEQMNHSNFITVESLQPLAVFGLTATLRLKIKQVRLKAYSLCGPVIYEYPLLKGQEQGYLSQGIATRVLYVNPVTRDEQKLLSWSKLYSSKIVENPERNWLVENLTREGYKRGKYIILLVTRVKHLKRLSDRLKDIPHRIISGTFNGQSVKVEDRIESKGLFEAGEIRLIIANTVFKKGVNLKRVDMIIDADAGRSENDAVQKFGRGIRKHEDKTGLLYFDINDWDEANTKNWFHIGSRYRTRALQRAGVKVYKVRWSPSLSLETLLVNAEGWLQQREELKEKPK